MREKREPFSSRPCSGSIPILNDNCVVVWIRCDCSTRYFSNHPIGCNFNGGGEYNPIKAAWRTSQALGPAAEGEFYRFCLRVASSL